MTFDAKFFENNYEIGDVIEIGDLLYNLGDGYGDPENVVIVTLKNKGFYCPAAFCRWIDEYTVSDPDGNLKFDIEEYGIDWAAIYCGHNLQWEGAQSGYGFLLDVQESNL